METAGSYVANGIEAEKAGQIAKAIDAYEKCIELQFEGNHPYDRLAITYRKQGQYDDEIRVLEKAIWVFENVAYSLRGDVPKKLIRFKERLVKAQELKIKKKPNAKIVRPTKQELNISNWKRKLFEYWKVSEKQYESFKKRTGSPYERDVIWGLYNGLALKTDPVEKKKEIYQDMARFLNEEGRDPYEMIKEARHLEILHFIKSEYGLDTKLKVVVPPDACSTCRADDRKIITLGDAYNNPFLPHQDCICISSGGKYPFCRCKYELLYSFET
jgi:tetratricopeptide (TPR) repeat protein